MLFALLLPLASAYETDQVTGRLLYLADATEVANDWADDLLDAAVTRTNAETQCKGDDDAIRRALAANIAEATARNHYVKERKLAGFGYGVYSALLETGAIDRHSFADRDDIYGTVTSAGSVVLASVGTCSTVRLAGELVGTDKADHFWALGYQYALLSDWGEKPEAALRWGTFTERAFYGLMTSAVFSYADLAANEAGYRFYLGLLDEGGMFRRDDDGCVVQTRGFDWNDWIDVSWDEAFNPPVYSRRVGRAVRERLSARRDAYCQDYQQWGDEYASHLAQVLAERASYASSQAPPRTDAYHLDELCAGWIPAPDAPIPELTPTELPPVATDGNAPTDAPAGTNGTGPHGP